MYLQSMSLQYFNRMSSTHALRVPADVQKVNRFLVLSGEPRAKPLPDFIPIVVLRNHVCDTLTVRGHTDMLQQS